MKIRRRPRAHLCLTFLFSVLLGITLLALHGRTHAQFLNCIGPPIKSDIRVSDPYWNAGSSVKVYFRQDHFTSAQRNTIKDGIEAWESRRFNNCSGVTFDDNTYAELASQPSSATVGSYIWIETQAGFSSSQTTRRRGWSS